MYHNFNWGGDGFAGYDGLMFGGGPSTNETKAAAISDQDQATKVAEQQKADSTLDQFSGPVDQSPFYHALKTSGIESTAHAYNDAKANLKTQALGAGFGYEQPEAQGANAQMEQSEATDMAAVPRQALLAATQPALTSASTRVGEENSFNPAPTLSTAAQLEMDRKNRAAGLVASIAKLGAGFIPVPGAASGV